MKTVDIRLLNGDEKMINSFLNEIKIMRAIDHPRILRLHDKIRSDNIVMLFTTFCEGGNLEDLTFSQKNGLGEKKATLYLKQLAEGFQAM